jgi:ssDNA-binding Zn-finger/Zn-ribbon topoisomerase 1
MTMEKVEPIEIECPKCKETQIVYIPKENIRKCPKCHIQMVIRELLDEGKSY